MQSHMRLSFTSPPSAAFNFWRNEMIGTAHKEACALTMLAESKPGGDVAFVAVAGLAITVLAADEQLHDVIPDGTVCIAAAFALMDHSHVLS
jgi:nicotinamide mononucleotide (NMN) deamidase PncC